LHRQGDEVAVRADGKARDAIAAARAELTRIEERARRREFGDERVFPACRGRAAADRALGASAEIDRAVRADGDGARAVLRERADIARKSFLAELVELRDEPVVGLVARGTVEARPA
jgi:hypothetical protein